MNRTRYPRLAILCSLLALVPAWASAAAPQEPLVVFLVRHAERVDARPDSELSAAGSARAAELATLLRDADIEHVHSSDFIRTRNTAAPTAAKLGLVVELYDPRNLPALVERLREAGGRHLVVGHSNTTPSAVELLGGEPGSEIDEHSEFDRLYVVTIGAAGAVGTVLMRYGGPYYSVQAKELP
ncbi:MAG: histidine phosphatase family protein [bacterium]|nr:histidine phosphatase family protein [bacterium]